MNKEAQCRQYRQDLDRSQRRLTELETRGIAAMSRYDIEIAHGGDADGALRMATWLVGNHIAYFTEKLTHCDDPVQQITLFDATLSSKGTP
jgi:hypothetical protein